MSHARSEPRAVPPEATVLEALRSLVELSEGFGVHPPSARERQALRDQAARAHAAIMRVTKGRVAPSFDRAVLLVRVDALVARLDHERDHEHDPVSWRAARAPLARLHRALHLEWEQMLGVDPALRHRALPHNFARNGFHMASGVAWALTYGYWLDRGALLWVLAVFLAVFFLDDAMRRWLPRQRSRFAVVVFRVLSRTSESSGIATSTWYTLGMLIGAVLLPKSAWLVGLLILAFADPAAGLVGRRWGTRRLYRHKSVVGTVAFFAVALVIAAIGLTMVQPTMGVVPRLGAAAAVALVGAVAELLGDHVPDNLSVLLASGTMVSLFVA